MLISLGKYNLIMSFHPSKSWKEELRGYCACFSDSKHAFGLSLAENDCSVCPAAGVKRLFLSKEKPTQTELVTEFLRTGNFKRKQLIGLLTDMYLISSNTAATRVAAILRPFREKSNSLHLQADAEGRYLIIKRSSS